MQEYPSYGDLIDLLEAAEIVSETDRDRSVADILTETFTVSYPHIPISRPSRFPDTVRRLAAPAKPSAVGWHKLTGSPLTLYHHRHWIPRIRRKQRMLMCTPDLYGVVDRLIKSVQCNYRYLHADPIVFPTSVQECDATERLLQGAFLQCLEGQKDLCWTLTKPVTVGFYRDLHHYLRQWPPARSATKTTVGSFYLLLDVNFKSGGMSNRPDNIYMFVQRVVNSHRLSSGPMYYGMDKTVEQLKSVVSGYQEDLKLMSHKVSEQQVALKEMKKQLEIASTGLKSSRRALSDVYNRLQNTVKQRDTARKQVCKIQDNLEGAYFTMKMKCRQKIIS